MPVGSRHILERFATRSNQPELMDDPGIEPMLLRQTLDDLERVNAIVGGHRTSIDGIQRLIGDATSLSVLDVGTGCGDLPRRLAGWAKDRNIDIDILGVDRSPVAVEHARRRCRLHQNIHIETRDLFEMSGRSRFDVVHAALVLHHFDDDRAIVGLRRMHQLSTKGVIINDLHRHPVGYAGARLILPLLSQNPLIRHDGPLSVLRAFVRDELRRLVTRARLGGAQIRWRPFFRWQMTIPREVS